MNVIMKSVDISTYTSQSYQTAEGSKYVRIPPGSRPDQNDGSVCVVIDANDSPERGIEECKEREMEERDEIGDRFVGGSERDSLRNTAGLDEEIVEDDEDDALQFHNHWNFSYKERRKRNSPYLPPSSSPFASLNPIPFHREMVSHASLSRIPSQMTPQRLPPTPSNLLFFSLPVSLPPLSHPPSPLNTTHTEKDRNVRSPYRSPVPDSDEDSQSPNRNDLKEVVVEQEVESKQRDSAEMIGKASEKVICSTLFMWRLLQATAILTYSSPSPPPPPPLPPPPLSSPPTSSWLPWPLSLFLSNHSSPPSPSPSPTSSASFSARQWFRHEAVRGGNLMRMANVILHSCVVNLSDSSLFGTFS
jgi:hypothetical protein